MAKSSKKRKNGTVVSRNVARIKRMRRLAAQDLANLIVCACVSLDVARGVDRMQPKVVVYHRSKKDIAPITKLQEVALKSERWRWNIHSAIVCRKQDGEVYLWKEENIFTTTEVTLQEMNDYIADTLCDHFEESNPLHRLTMLWVAAPYDMGDVPLEAVLAPLHYHRVLGQMLTQYELENKDHVVVSYQADTLSAFAQWFVDQSYHRKSLELRRTITFCFEANGNKMKKGELVAFRERMASLKVFDGTAEFAPRATVDGFVKWGKQTVVCTGVRGSELMSVLQSVPPCVNCLVDVLIENGEEKHIKFYFNKMEVRE